MARRFFIDRELVDNEIFEITGDEARHIFVLRYNIGDKIVINDKVCEIINFEKKSVFCKVCNGFVDKGVPGVNITLYQALLKSDKLEYVIQKSVELGVSRIIPFISNNVIVKIDKKDMLKKIDRWNKISLEASKQCGRCDIVKVDGILSFSELSERITSHEKSIIAYEKEKIGLKTFLRVNSGLENIGIVIGAEGGFDESEIEELLKKENCISVSLGKRILRAETASLNLLSILMYELEH